MALRLYAAPLTEDMDTEKIKSESADHDASLRSYNINAYPADYTLELLVDKWNKGDIETAPGQRRYVWNQIRASKLIESFLIGLPVPPVYLYQDKDTGKLLIVDGQQRVKTLAFFFSGTFGEKTGDEEKDRALPDFKLLLHEKSPYFEETFSSLQAKQEPVWRKFKDVVMRAVIMKQIYPKDDTSIYQVFERLNTGGMILYPQEIRNCVIYGTFNDLLKKLNKYESWRVIVGGQTSDKRMRDVELILRFFAIFYNLKNYKKPMKQFLYDFMEDNRNPSKVKLKSFEHVFKRTSDTVVKYLGAKPFHVHVGLNAAVYDAVFTAFAKNINQLDRPNVTQVQLKKIRRAYARLKEQEAFKEWTSSATTDESVIPKRLRRAMATFK